MTAQPLLLHRPPLMPLDELAQIEEAMLRLLEECGLAVADHDLQEQLRRLGFSVRADRAFLERNTVREFLDEERRLSGNQFSAGPAPPGPVDQPIRLFVSEYPQHVHDIDTDQVVPFTTERLIEATRLVDAASERGVPSSPPGCPADVPPALQPVVQYWVAATYSRHGRHPVDPKAEVSFRYVMEMAEVLGNPVRGLPVYVFSPLTLAGESLRCVLAFRDQLDSVTVSSMPSAGCTAPINVADAFALAAAEVIGSAILVRELTGLRTHWHISLLPLDLRTMAMVFGSPENFLFQLIGEEVCAYFAGRQWGPAAGNIHTNAKLPGAQACAEKASLMTAGALLGQRSFGAAGTLSLDEVFSGEQLLYDLEIKDHVERLVRGVDVACDPQRCVEDVAEALRLQSFAGLDSTLERYRDLYWHPRLFDRQFLAAWMASGGKSIRETTQAMMRDLAARHDYRLEPELQRELDAILARARDELR